MSVRTTNLATHGLLKMNLTLGFHINHIHNLGMWLHQFCLGKHNSAARKVLKAYSDQHQVIAGINGSPTMVDAAYLTVPDGVSLPVIVAMLQITHTCLRVVLDTLLGRDHPAS